MTHYALTDCPLRVVVNFPQSRIGYTYPNVYIEVKAGEQYVNIDVCLEAAFSMGQKDFEDWWSDAESSTLHAVCDGSMINEEALRRVLKQMRPDCFA